ncbi:hypothetical protein BH09BAC6_BH09BAC6_35640 [soil metagenome]
MLEQIPIKKEYLLIAATVVLLFICYRVAFAKTAEAWQLNRQLKTQLAQATDLSYQPEYLERKRNNLAKIINLYKADTIDFRSNIISTIASIAEKENVKLTEVPTQDPFYHTDKFIIQKLSFSGDYFALSKVLNQLQAAKGIGIARGAAFKTMRNRSNGNDINKLILEVYLEILK